MKDYSDMTRHELVERLRSLETGEVASEREALIHSLEVHQAELESQNQQLREAQALLEESRGRYADLYDFAPIAYCTFDAQGCIVEINLTGAALLGAERSRLIGKPFLLFVAHLDRPAFLKHLKDCLGKGQECSTDLTLALKGQPPLVVQMVTRHTLDENRQAARCRATLTDISERKRGEAALRLAVRMREDFLAVVSHDLKNPLSSMVLGTQGLLRIIPETDQERSAGRQLLMLMQRSAVRMNRLIEDLLDLSSMDAGHLSMCRKLSDLIEVLSAIVEIVGPMAAKKSIRVETKSEGAPLFAFCDRDRVIQALLNLVGNAIKFTPEGGRVCIEARQQASQVLVAVCDNGPGIPPQQLAHVFDAYWQGERSPGKGTGLGLSIARGIIEFHGGKLWAESEVGRGSTFFLTLPSTQPEIQTQDGLAERVAPILSTPVLGLRPQAPPPSAERARAERLVLVVDNDQETRDSLSAILQAEGYAVTTKDDGAQALEYLKQTHVKPFLILLDIDMPVMDGAQFLTQREKSATLADIPVIMISGQSAPQASGALLGYDGYIQKPIGIATLLQKVQQIERSHLAPRSTVPPTAQ